MHRVFVAVAGFRFEHRERLVEDEAPAAQHGHVGRLLPCGVRSTARRRQLAS